MNTRHGSTTVHATFRETQALLREIAHVDPDRAAQLFRDWIQALDGECPGAERHGEVRDDVGDDGHDAQADDDAPADDEPADDEQANDDGVRE